MNLPYSYEDDYDFECESLVKKKKQQVLKSNTFSKKSLIEKTPTSSTKRVCIIRYANKILGYKK